MADDQIVFGSDAIVSLLCTLGVDYAALNPGASFRGIHDSLVNRSRAPKLIQCCHEEISVAIAHGYAKAAGKPMVACTHDIVGLQHASMAIFNAWCDRVPALVIGGGGPRNASRRRPWIEWIHSALPQSQVVRDYVKWDDEPGSLDDVPESLARAYRAATTNPAGPVYVNFDVSIQESRVPDDYILSDIARYLPGPPPAVPAAELERLASALASAERPVIVVDRVQSPLPVISLAETLGAPVFDRGSRVGFPSRHPLNLSGAEESVLAQADFVLALEVEDLFGATHRWHAASESFQSLAPSARVAHIGLREFGLRSWAADHQRLTEVDYSLLGDADAAAANLAELLCGRIPASTSGYRAEAAARIHGDLRAGWTVQAARFRKQMIPVHPAAIASILWESLAKEKWCLANDSSSGWARRLWSIDEARQHLGGSGGGGIGYGAGAAIGAALAHAQDGTIVVDIHGDGDLLYTPSALWTLAKYELPVLVVMNNNRAYGNSLNHAIQIGRLRGRPGETAEIGNTITGPQIDFGGLARAFGVWAEEPVTQTCNLHGAIVRALNVIKEGHPALIDVVTESPSVRAER
ncbi:MAG: thiamine pyrophosphate-binding protein [Chloroflexota bacterium]